MRFKNNLLIYISILLLTVGCGYKVVNQSNLSDYNLLNIEISGSPRIDYTIKNQLLNKSSKKSNNLISLEIKTSKKTIIKNKNIKNEVTDYELIIQADVKYKINNKESKIIIVETDVYKVNDQRLNTINNEKNLTNLLTNKIVEKILSNLNREINDN